MTNKFFTAWDKWQADCKQELKQKGFTDEQIEGFDICENGGVFFGNLGFSGSDFVTRWSASEHFTE